MKVAPASRHGHLLLSPWKYRSLGGTGLAIDANRRNWIPSSRLPWVVKPGRRLQERLEARAVGTTPSD